MNSDILAPARRCDWALYDAVKAVLDFLAKGASKVDAYATLMELGVSRQRAGELIVGVNVR